MSLFLISIHLRYERFQFIVVFGQQQAQSGAPGVQPQAAQPQPVAQAPTQNGQPDYSAQWAEYYRTMGKIKEAEAIEASMKSKVCLETQFDNFYFGI